VTPAPQPGTGVPDDAVELRVIRSDRRRKSAQGRLVGGVLEVRIPAHISTAEEVRLVDHFRRRLLAGRTAAGIDLAARAVTLARAHDLPEPREIRWVANQRHRWGSCTPARATIRISDRAAGFPPWVLDYLVVHELAHLVEANHSPTFWALVARYPLAERARGFLIAKGWDEPGA
jgi:hypothetical protein